MNAELIEIAEALNYSKLERLRLFSKTITPNVANDILKASISEPYAILFFKAKLMQITPYGTRLSIVYSPHKSEENYLLAHPELSDKFLRQIFTGFELVLYKLCHIHLHEQSRDYQWETEKTRQRIRKIRQCVSYGFRVNSSSPAATSEASPSSRCAAPPLRFGRYAMTAPLRCGGVVSMIFDERSRP